MEGARIRVSAFEVPTRTPQADGTLAWQSTVLVTVELSCRGATGLGYTYADVSTAHFIRAHLATLAVAGHPMSPGMTFRAMDVAVRNLGREGIAATAIAAVDMARWDLKARLLGLPVVDLIGRHRTSIEAYASGGFTSYSLDELRRQCSGWRDEGFSRVKMKIGSDESTLARVKAARDAVGTEIELFVDANGAFDPKSALGVAQRLARYGVAWFEEPVSSDDLEGLRFVRERGPPTMAIAAGEYGYRLGYFDRMLERGAVDVLQADATRCGVTGFLGASASCEAKGVSLSAHCAPSVHTHLACAVRDAVHVEYFYDHSRIEQMFFDGARTAREGALQPDFAHPGFGLALKRADAARFCVYDT